jgi:hypothetical protein
VPDKTLNIITKVNEAANPEVIPDNEVVQFDNMVLNAIYSKATKRGGFLRFNTNDASGGFTDLFDVSTRISNYVLGNITGTTNTLSKSLNGTSTWTDIKTGLTANKNLKMAAYSDNFFFTNNTDTPFWTDLTNTGNININAPDVSGMVGAISADSGLTLSSKYYWAVAYESDLGELSPVSLPFTYSSNPSFSSQNFDNTTDLTSGAVDLSNIPVSSDTRVVTKVLYRTQANGDVLYFLDRILNSQTTYHDNIADTNLDLSITTDIGVQFNTIKSLTVNKDRLLVANMNIPDAIPRITYGAIYTQLKTGTWNT